MNTEFQRTESRGQRADRMKAGLPTTAETVAAPLASVLPLTEFLTKRELAALLKVTVRTLETWLREGRLPFIKVSKSVRFHWPTVLAHLNSKGDTLKTES